MGWKKDLMKGLVEVKGEVARVQGIIVTQDATIQRQQQVIEKLLDRIQAPSFRELKSVPSGEEKYDSRAIAEFYEKGAPLMDDDVAGMAIPVEE